MKNSQVHNPNYTESNIYIRGLKHMARDSL